MNGRRPYSLLQIRELGHGIHDLPGFDTGDFRSFAVGLGPNKTRLPIARSPETLLLVVEGRPHCRLVRSDLGVDRARRR